MNSMGIELRNYKHILPVPAVRGRRRPRASRIGASLTRKEARRGPLGQSLEPAPQLYEECNKTQPLR